MTDSDHENSLRDRILRTYCWSVVLIGLYVFSMGPLSWRYYNSLNLGENRLTGLYFAPITLARENCAPFDNWSAWYMEMWMFGPPTESEKFTVDAPDPDVPNQADVTKPTGATN